MKKYSFFSVVICLILLIVTASAVAAPKSGKVNRLAKQYRNLDRQSSKLVKQFKRLSSSQKESLLGKLGDRYDDVDNDNLPDFLDSGSGRCDSDSDDDGILDGDDHDDDDDDSNASPSPSSTPTQGNEIEIHGLIQTISGTALSVNGSTFALTGNTVYRDRDNNTTTQSAFSAGQCVEVEGHSSGGNLTAEKVKMDDDC